MPAISSFPGGPFDVRSFSVFSGTVAVIFPGGKKLGHLRKVVMICVFDMYVLLMMLL